jgi:hypothetical protein
MPELMDYTESNQIVTLYRDFFDFEKIYYNRKAILRWVVLSKRYGMDFINEAKTEIFDNVIELPKKRGK